MYIYIHAHTHTYIHLYTKYTDVYIYTYMYIFVYIYIYVIHRSSLVFPANIYCHRAADSCTFSMIAWRLHKRAHNDCRPQTHRFDEKKKKAKIHFLGSLSSVRVLSITPKSESSSTEISGLPDTTFARALVVAFRL